MSFLKCLFFICITFVMANQTHAENKAPTESMPMPAKELEAFMKGFVGTWKCQTTFPAGAFGPGSSEVKTKAVVTMKKELNGFFYQGEYKAAKAKGMPAAFHGMFYLGYDQGSKQIINVSVDDTGSASMAAGPITANSATWSGEAYMMGSKVKVREVMTLKGPKEAYHKFEVDMGQGFQTMGEDTCQK